MHRYFKILNNQIYEESRILLDNNWGIVYPQTCIEPAITAPRDDNGYILLALNEEFCEYTLAKEILSESLRLKYIEEINKDIYFTTIRQSNDV